MSNIVTAEGYEKLKSQLRGAKEKLKEIAERIKDARELGDLSENAEYHEAKNEQSFLLGRELELEQKIKNAKIIADCKGDVVGAGCTVILSDKGERQSYQIVGSDESDPLKGRISNDSPIGSALMGHKKGDKVTVLTPSGKFEYRIDNIK